MNDDDPVRLVAITGGSGAGKSWLADRLHHLIGAETGRLSQDQFYRDCSHLPAAERDQVNFDHPDALDWDHFAASLDELRRGRGCQLPVYDFGTHRRLPGGEPVAARRLMIVDGLWLLHHPAVRRHFALTIFLHCAEEERLRRRIARDIVERDRTEASVREQFQATVAPMHRKFVSPQAAHADLLLHCPCRDAEILQLEERLSRLIPLKAEVVQRFADVLRPAVPPPALASPLAVLS